jgi:hypothetical protein
MPVTRLTSLETIPASRCPSFLLFGTRTTIATHNFVNTNRGTLPRLDQRNDPTDDIWADRGPQRFRGKPVFWIPRIPFW